jgi:hypothetical protein
VPVAHLPEHGQGIGIEFDVALAPLGLGQLEPEAELLGLLQCPADLDLIPLEIGPAEGQEFATAHAGRRRKRNDGIDRRGREAGYKRLQFGLGQSLADVGVLVILIEDLRVRIRDLLDPTHRVRDQKALALGGRQRRAKDDMNMMLRPSLDLPLCVEVGI